MVKDDQVLVRVRAAGVNWADWSMVRGLPLVMRAGYGTSKPRGRVRGTDVAGSVEAVGAKVSSLKPDDEVYGWCQAAFAEYVAVDGDHLVPKPASITFEQAAGVPMGGFVALQALRDIGKVTAGQKVLVVGASGGIGTFTVQIAKALGAEVTGVCSTATSTSFGRWVPTTSSTTPPRTSPKVTCSTTSSSTLPTDTRSPNGGRC